MLINWVCYTECSSLVSKFIFILFIGVEITENIYFPEVLHSLTFKSKLIKVVGGMHHTLFLDDAGKLL